LLVKEFRLYLGKIFQILIGSLITAVAVNGFLIPYKILSGGVTGIAILIHYFFHLSPGLLIFLLNIPIFLLGARYISKRFTSLSLIGMLSFAFFLPLTKGLVFPVQDLILAAVFGGILSGLGMGIVFRKRGSLGGTDIIAVIFNKYSSMSIGTILLSFNGVILLLSAFYFNLQLALYTMITMYVSARVVDFVQDGLNYRKNVMIISDRAEEIASRILVKLSRGVTFLHGEGAYTHRQKEIIYCIIKTMELPKLKELVTQVDPRAFMAVSDTKEVLGQGFYIEDFK